MGPPSSTRGCDVNSALSVLAWADIGNDQPAEGSRRDEARRNPPGLVGS